MWVIIDNIHINTASLEGYTKSKFKAEFGGKLRDVDKAWEQVRGKIPKPAKKTKTGRK